MNRKFRTSVILMIAAIIMIAAFQVYWLNIKVAEEKRTLRFRTNVIFRESVFDLQSSKLKLDSTTRMRYGFPPGIARFADMVRKRLLDSSGSKPDQPGNSFITLERPINPKSNDTVPSTGYRAGGRFFEFLMGIDSLQDSIRIKDIRDAYIKNLQKEKINVPFNIVRTIEKDFKRSEPGRQPEWNKVTVGLSHPISYTVELGNTFRYILKQLMPEIIFSLFLIGFTIIAFSVLFKNLKAQQRLTNIKNEFISNITHELKTPISTVSVAIEAIKNFGVLQQPERAKEYLDIAGNEMNRLSLLVDKVLKLSMFEKQQTELKYEKFDIKQLASEVIASMGLQFEKAKAKVHLHISGENFLITADHLHITSVLYNLLDNALKYSRENPVIDVNISCEQKECVVSVKDNGIGIAPEYRDKIFEKFFRVPSYDKHNIKGYGLGLSYVAHIVMQHNGNITVHSEPGKGSEFIVKLPVTNAKD